MRLSRHLSFGFLILAAVSLLAFSLPATSFGQVSQKKKEEALAMLEEMIPYRTAKGYGQLPAFVDYLTTILRDAGFSDDEIIEVPLNIDGEDVSGLIVHYAAAGESSLDPVVFMAHMDVVDALPKNWNTDPYKPEIIDGYLYGRGAQDNKFGVALLISTFVNLKKSGFEPERDLLLAFAGDEETGMLTTRKILENPLIKNADFALNSDAGGGSMSRDGKPLAFTMQTAEKAYATFTLSTKNPGGHSSAPKSENAIYELAHALLAVEKLQFPVQFNEITRSMARQTAKREGGEVEGALNTLLQDPDDSAAIAIMKRYPQFSNILWTTCVATMLEAGHAENALPQDAQATVNCRILPDTGGVDHVRAALDKAIGNDAVVITEIGETVESPASPIREDVLQVLQKGVAVNYPGMTLQPVMSSGGTEGREYRVAGIPTYGAGSLALVRPDDSRAHGPNERLPVESFYKEMDYWDYVVRTLGGGDVK